MKKQWDRRSYKILFNHPCPNDLFQNFKKRKMCGGLLVEKVYFT